MKKLGFAVFVILLISFFLLRKTSDEALTPAPPPSIQKEVPAESVKAHVEKSVEKPPEEQNLPEHLKKQGYEIDPSNPDQAIKKEIKNGREITTTVELGGFEPKVVSSQEALSLLEKKRAEDPEEEMKGMHNSDFNSDSSMILGKFKDKNQDIELYILLRDSDNFAIVCLSFPEKTFKALKGDYILRADASGYGIIKFNDREFLRLTWAMEKGRTIFAQFLKRTPAEVQVLKSFAATEISRAKGEKLDRCP